MATTLRTPPAHSVYDRDPLFDIVLPKTSQFYLKLRAAGAYLTKMKASPEIVMRIYQISLQDIEYFTQHYPEDSFLFQDVLHEKAT